VAQDVLDVLGADVPGGHYLGHRALRGGIAEQLDEEDEALRLARERAAAAAKTWK